MDWKMKKNSLNALLFVVMIISIVSCSKESQYEKRIIGEWYCFEDTRSTHDDFDFIFKESRYLFTKDGLVYYMPSWGGRYTGRYEIRDETLFIDYLITWSYTIDELSKTIMKLTAADGEKTSLQKQE